MAREWLAPRVTHLHHSTWPFPIIHSSTATVPSTCLPRNGSTVPKTAKSRAVTIVYLVQKFKTMPRLLSPLALWWWSPPPSCLAAGPYAITQLCWRHARAPRGRLSNLGRWGHSISRWPNSNTYTTNLIFNFIHRCLIYCIHSLISTHRLQSLLKLQIKTMWTYHYTSNKWYFKSKYLAPTPWIIATWSQEDIVQFRW